MSAAVAELSKYKGKLKIYVHYVGLIELLKEMHRNQYSRERCFELMDANNEFLTLVDFSKNKLDRALKDGCHAAMKEGGAEVSWKHVVSRIFQTVEHVKNRELLTFVLYEYYGKNNRMMFMNEIEPFIPQELKDSFMKAKERNDGRFKC